MSDKNRVLVQPAPRVGATIEPERAAETPETVENDDAGNTKPPKKIILLSDGTGNSERSPFKTNVWRTYQALRLAQGKQIAYYDNGVGTSTFRPLALLGGAIGWGLKRNVLELYKFLCRSYEPGDFVYGFGFSRGAFTIRVLVALVEDQGLVRYRNADRPPIAEETLARYAAEAYRDYRKRYYIAPLAVVGRLVRDAFIEFRDRLVGLTPYDKNNNIDGKQVHFHFLGLWDTVDAYGLPIREVKTAVDRYIWPLTFHNLELGDNVRSARQALALDDERATFHPLVWNELGEDEKVKANRVLANRIRQVWFAGAHANVGGGYPDDSLAYVSLIWMLDEAKEAELEFEPEFIRLYKATKNPFGKIYDPRAGRAAFYRYSPRRIDRSPDEPYSTCPLVHSTVFERMQQGQYAPLSIYGDIARVGSQAGVPQTYYNKQAMELVLDTVWWRRIAYWAMMFTAGVVFFFPWLPKIFPTIPDEAVRQRIDGSVVLSLAKKLAPAFTDSWIDAFVASPVSFPILLLIALATFLWGRRLRDRVADRARAAWQTDPATTIASRAWLGQAATSNGAVARLLLVLGTAIFAAALAAEASPSHGAPTWLVAVAGALLVLPFIAGMPRIERARASVAERRADRRRRTASIGLTLRLARYLRTNRRVQATGWFLTGRAIPFFFTVFVCIAGFYVLNKLGFAILNAADVVCKDGADPADLKKPGTKPVSLGFDISNPCLATGVRLAAGGQYKISFVDPKNWHDVEIGLSSIGDRSATEGSIGFDTARSLLAGIELAAAAPMRRNYGANWLGPLAQIGGHSREQYVLAPHYTEITPQHSGELFLYVNEAVFGFPGIWNRFYQNDKGTVTVWVQELAPPPSE